MVQDLSQRLDVRLQENDLISVMESAFSDLNFLFTEREKEEAEMRISRIQSLISPHRAKHFPVETVLGGYLKFLKF